MGCLDSKMQTVGLQCCHLATIHRAAHNRWSVSRLPLASNICGFTHLTYWLLGVSAFAQPAVLSWGKHSAVWWLQVVKYSREQRAQVCGRTEWDDDHSRGQKKGDC